MKKLIPFLLLTLLLAGCGKRDKLMAESMANIKAAAQATLDGAPAGLTLPAIMKEADAVAKQLGYTIDINKGVNND